MTVDKDLLLQLIGIISSLLISMLFASTEKIIRRKICLWILLLIGIFLSVGLYCSATYFLTKLLIVIFAIIYISLIIYAFISMRETISVSRMNKRIHQFTESAATSSIIKIYGGDLNFFGNYDINDPIKGIAANSVFRQLKDLERRNIQVHILCKSPQTQAERMRIGYLAKKLKYLSLAFYSVESKNCTDCLLVDQCEDLLCEHSYRLEHCCKKMQNHCPDLKFRGRIVTQNNNANYVLVTNWVTPNRVYEKLIIYKPDSRECNFYIKLWEIMWNDAQQYSLHTNKIVDDCKKLITD